MMKNIFLIMMFLFVYLHICTAQDEQNPKWKGTVKFDAADCFINLHNALPGVSVRWTPFIKSNLGIPVEVDINAGWGVLPGIQTALLCGLEYIPVGPANREKNGLLFDIKIGVSLFLNGKASADIILKADAGYQLVTGRGFIFSPAIGAIYNGRTGLGFNMILGLGFAYR